MTPSSPSRGIGSADEASHADNQDTSSTPLVLHGDCLDAIAQAQSQLGPFDLIYVDPPYNAGGSRGARSGKGQRTRGTTAYRDVWGGLDGFLEMFAPRMTAMRDALSEVGTLWLHLDYRAVHDVKVQADKLFGRAGFKGEIIWVPGNGGRKKALSVTHQTILVYSKGRDFLFNADSPVLREPYAQTSQRMHFKQTDADGRRYRERTINGKTYRYYAEDGRRLGSVWTDCPAMRANTPLNPESTGYPTQKPESLLERIVLSTTHEGSAVLDPMCGSGTTVAVAARLGRRAAGIDQSEVAIEVVQNRLARQLATTTSTPPNSK